MTDHPRFQMVNAEPDRCYRQYHGAALVTWVLSAADWWLSRRPRRENPFSSSLRLRAPQAFGAGVAPK